MFLTRPLPLADGVEPFKLAPEERRYDNRTEFDRTSGRGTCTPVLFTSTAGRLVSAHGLCDKFRYVFRVLARVDLGRHLTVAVRATLVDGIENELLVGRELVQVRTHPSDGVGRLERVTQTTATSEQLLAV